MILRDPVHGLVAFEGDYEAVVKPLLDARELQRLRNVRQLGLTSLVFPGAEHSRFAHALGAAHVMVRLLARIEDVQHVLPPELRLDREARMEAVAAALLHDLGHGPFSHLFEEVLPDARRHEAWTLDVIRDPSTDVHRTLRALSDGMPERVAGLLQARHRLPYLTHTVSGTLDVDRFDYLLRDSHMTGVGYGVYDLDWLLHAFAFDRAPAHEGEASWVLAVEGRKGLPSVEGFFLARQFMFQQVYHHKTSRAAECLIRGIFGRVVELVREGRAPAATPAALRASARGEPVALGDYLALDDVQVSSCFRVWESEGDAVLADLTRRLAGRRLPKTLSLPAATHDAARWREAYEHARAAVEARRLPAQHHLWLDIARDTPYAEPEGPTADGIWVSLRQQGVRRIGDVSFLLGELRNKRIERPRLIFPPEARNAIEACVEPMLESHEKS